MLISGVSDLLNATSAAAQKRPQPSQPGFQQLQELETTNLQAAPSNGALTPASQSTFLTPPSNSPIAQALAQFSQLAQTGNIPATQQDYSAPQSLQSQAAPVHHHHHHSGGSSAASGSNAISQLFQQLGKALQTGNLTEAQQTYSGLVSDLPQTGEGNIFASAAPASTTGVSVTA